MVLTIGLLMLSAVIEAGLRFDAWIRAYRKAPEKDRRKKIAAPVSQSFGFLSSNSARVARSPRPKMPSISQVEAKRASITRDVSPSFSVSDFHRVVSGPGLSMRGTIQSKNMVPKIKTARRLSTRMEGSHCGLCTVLDRASGVGAVLRRRRRDAVCVCSLAIGVS
jgi:hypothetical protein